MKKSRILFILGIILATTLACSSLDAGSLMATVEALITPTVVYEETAIPAEPTKSGQPTPERNFVLPTVEPVEDAANTETLSAFDTALSELYARVNPGVVYIQTTSHQGNGLGSGFVLDMEGHIVTNYHVVEGADLVEVDFPSGLKTYGEVIATDGDTDLAVIKVNVDSKELKPIPLGDSDALKVGQVVVAIGNPFGLSGSMTMGIVSAKGRMLNSLRTVDEGSGTYYSAGDIIQTDALINPGNSGGPLINLRGEIIGINRAIETSGYSISGSAVNSGIGYSISINVVKKILPDLINYGRYRYPYLGIRAIEELSLPMMKAMNIQYQGGAYVVETVKGGPADKAGMKGDRVYRSTTGQSDTLKGGGDLIIAADGAPIKNYSELISYMIKYKSVGETIELTVLRDGKEVVLPVVLGERP